MSKGYIFDYGGTLDTGGCHWGKAIWHAYERQNVPVEEEQFREAYVFTERTLGSNPIIQSDYSFRKTLSVKVHIQLKRLADLGHLSLNEQETEDLHDRILEDLYSKVKEETARSREVLLALRKEHRLVLVSNFYGNISVVLKEFGLDDIFCGIIESAVVGIRKPDPRIFSMGVELLGTEAADVIVVGDSVDKDIIPAKKAGCETVWIKGEGWTEQQEECLQADNIIYSLQELLS